MNHNYIENIKNSGFQLGLEAELNVQIRGLADYVKDSKYRQARQCCQNCAELLDELVKITQPVQAQAEPKPTK